MILIMVLFWIAVYIAVSIVLVKLVKKFTPDKKLYRRLALAFVILLPTWDLILGYLVYFPACYFIPKTAIYETAETDGIYYEGQYNRVRFLNAGGERVNSTDYDLQKGYKYVESLVTMRDWGEPSERKIKPVIYRCTPLPRDPKGPAYFPTNCVPIDKATSGYLVRTSSIGLGDACIRFVKIINRSSGRLMAERRTVSTGLKENFISFIDATCMDVTRGCVGGARIESSQFQYDVLKPKK